MEDLKKLFLNSNSTNKKRGLIIKESSIRKKKARQNNICLLDDELSSVDEQSSVDEESDLDESEVCCHSYLNNY